MDNPWITTIGIAGALSVLVTAFLVGTSVASSAVHAKPAMVSTGDKLFFGVAAVGWFAVVFFGVKGLLSWLPDRYADLVNSVAGGVALVSLFALPTLVNLPVLRWRLRVLEEAGSWERQTLKFTAAPSPGDLEALEQESKDARRSELEQAVAATKLGFARALVRRDEQLRQDAVRAYVAAQDTQRVADEKARRERDEQEAEARKSKALDELLQCALRPLPVVADLRALSPGMEALVDERVLQGAWRRLQNVFSGVFAKTQSASDETARHLQTVLAAMPVARLPAGVEVVVDFHGTERDGYRELLAVVEGARVPLWKVLAYTESVDGFLVAHYLAVALPEAWSWGHGRYDRDASPLLTAAGLRRALGEPLHLPAAESGAWPPPGVRVCRTESGWTVSSLVARPGRGLLDAKVVFEDARAVQTSTVDVAVWGQGVYY